MSECQADFELRFRGKMQYKVQDPNDSHISQNFGLDLVALGVQRATWRIYVLHIDISTGSDFWVAP